MLMILSAVDGKFDDKECDLIRKYMEENFSEKINFDKEKEIIHAIASVDYPVHFNNAMNLFYMQSSHHERNSILNMATQLVVSDNEITPRENLFLNELYYAWEEHTEE